MSSYIIRYWCRFGTSLAVLACGSFFLQAAASGATIKVTSANDSGSGTLREAITAANASVFSDTIIFQLSGQDRTIDLTSALPDLSTNISIINSGQPVTVQRSSAFRTPEFFIFTISAGRIVILEGLIITKGVGGVKNHGSLTMRNCTLHQNSDRGAIHNYANGSPARLNMRDCVLTENRLVDEVPTVFPYAGGGGALLNFSENAAASASLINCVLQRNSVYRAQIVGPPGGAIANVAFPNGSTTLSLSGCTLEDNDSNGTAGGGIYNFTNGANARASVTLVDSTLRDNTGGRGGGIMNNPGDPLSGLVTVENCTFAGNGAGSGGAVYNRGGITLTNCTLSENLASSTSADNGGGALHNSGGTADVTNCTFKDNVADNEARGSSIYNVAAGTVTTANSIYDRVGGSDVHFVDEGTFTSRGHNICDDNAGGPLGTGPGGLLDGTDDRRLTSPGLLALASNGGPTQTCALEQSSVAINAGDDTIAPATDQRGYARSGVSDIGAYERTAAVPTSLKPGRLGNISTRLGVETGDNVLIGGFIVTGTEPKKLMLRAIGTSLPFVNRLQNPTLELFDSSGASIEANDNWVDSANKQAIIDSTIPPSNDLESAMVVYLPADGAGYTAIVRGAGGTTGVALVEIYDLDSAVDSKLANISTRGLVQTGDNVLIAGTIVTGQASQRVIIRAIGPSLPFPGKLEDPTLELIDANGAQVAANDNWRTGGQEAAINATGVPPSNELESAIVYQLPSNNASHTAIVRGLGGTTGIAVIEVYALPPFSFGP